MTDGLNEAVAAVRGEVNRASIRFGEFNSTHEALGVLIEEVRELEDAIRSNDVGAVAKESMQVSAVAMRLYSICRRAVDGDAADFSARSGGSR